MDKKLESFYLYLVLIWLRYTGIQFICGKLALGYWNCHLLCTLYFSACTLLATWFHSVFDRSIVFSNVFLLLWWETSWIEDFKKCILTAHACESRIELLVLEIGVSYKGQKLRLLFTFVSSKCHLIKVNKWLILRTIMLSLKLMWS